MRGKFGQSLIMIATLCLAFIGTIHVVPSVAQAEGLTLGDLDEGAIVKDIEGFTERWIVLSHNHYGPGNTLLFLKGVDPAGTRQFDSGTVNWGGSALKTYIDTTFKDKLSSQFNAAIRQVTIADGGIDYPNTDVFLLSYRELGGTNTAFTGGKYR